MLRRILEALKTAVIVLLLLSILPLSLMVLPSGIVSGLPLPGFLTSALGLTEAPPDLQDLPSQHITAASPMMLSIRQTGGRATIRRDPDAMDEAFELFSSLLRDGLTTADSGQLYTGDWSFLDAPGVLFLYDGSIPAQALCRWIGEEEGSVSDIAGGYLLACEADGVILYTISDEEIRRYGTAVSYAALSSLLSQYTPDGTEFAYRREGSTAAPLTLWETSVSLPICTTINPVTQEFSNTLAAGLDFNPYGAGTYTSPDGSTTYTEADRSLTVDPDGHIALSVSGENYTRFHAASASPSDLIDTAGDLLNTVFADTPEDAVLSLCGFRQEEDLTLLTYRYTLSGVPVYPACAEVTFRGSALSALSCTLRTFVQRSTVSELMPLPQAAAIAAPGKRLLPAYDLSVSGTVKPGWRAQ